jgi:hypothetical protein
VDFCFFAVTKTPGIATVALLVPYLEWVSFLPSTPLVLKKACFSTELDVSYEQGNFGTIDLCMRFFWGIRFGIGYTNARWGEGMNVSLGWTF